jgi:predicted alpha-1,6-mannanase (GH76 family)
VTIALAAVLAIVGLGYKWLSPLDPHGPAAAASLADPPSRAQLSTDAAGAVAKLASMYDPTSDKATRSWKAANVLSTLTWYMQQSGSRAYLPYLQETYAAHPGQKAFINSYYDDEGWWALTWIRAYDLTGDPHYLGRAEAIFANLTRGWTSACGGGLLWSKFSPYKDAISNELFLQVAAQLHSRVPGDVRYRRWALREWHWLHHSGMLRPSGLVVDGLTSSCQPALSSTIWSYNQGGMIGGLLDLEQIIHQHRLLGTARTIANAVIHSPALSPGGILEEPCQPGLACGQDAPTFKGIFVQNLQRLFDRIGHPAYSDYLLRNAQSLWLRDRQGDGFGLRWQGPFDLSNTARQIAAADLLITQVAAG